MIGTQGRTLWTVVVAATAVGLMFSSAWQPGRSQETGSPRNSGGPGSYAGASSSEPAAAGAAQATTSTGASTGTSTGEISPAGVYFRRPTAAAWDGAARHLLVAHRDSGSVSVLDADTFTVVGEHAVGKRLVDLAALPSGNHWLAVDEGAGELIALAAPLAASDSPAAPIPQVAQRLPLPGAYPVSVAALGDDRACVASLWSRELIFIEASAREAGGGRWRIAARLRLPFAPRLLQRAGGPNLVVADAFAGQLALIDVAAVKILGVKQLPVHNIRGLAYDGERLWFGCQELNPVARASFDDIHWGILVDNQIRNLPLAALTAADAPKSVDEIIRERIARGDRISLGGTGQGAADPAGLHIEPDGWRVVALSGSHEVAVISTQRAVLNFLPVGQRPIAVIARPGARQAFVLNQFSDSVSVIDLQKGILIGKQIALGSMPTLSSKQRGEKLFYDARLSHDRWMSCHSCHPDGHSTGGLVDTLGDESYGAPKRVLSLLGVSQTDTWAWNGTIKELHDQVRKSIDSTMHGHPPSGEGVQDLVAFMFSLGPPPPAQPPANDADGEAIARGKAVFQRQGCGNCHVPPLTYTTQGAFDVGLRDEHGQEKFNPPSLLGVGHRDRLFHDNRAVGLESVFREFGHQLEAPLADGELADLVRFLRSL